MAILTSKMKTARKDYGGCVKMFFPLNEGSGTSFSDIEAGSTLTDAGAGHSAVHSATMYESDFAAGGLLPYTIPTSGTLVLCASWQVVTAGVFAKILIGGDSADESVQIQQTSGPTATVKNGGTAVNCTGTTSPTNGQKYFQALVLDLDALTVANYDAITTADVAANGTPADVSAIDPRGMVLGNKLTVNVGAGQHTYGIALLHFANGTPSDLVTGLTYMKNRWQAGHKEIYPGWDNLA